MKLIAIGSDSINQKVHASSVTVMQTTILQLNLILRSHKIN